MMFIDLKLSNESKVVNKSWVSVKMMIFPSGSMIECRGLAEIENIFF